MIASYRDLIVWQKSVSLVVEIYKVAKYFPRDEVYGLTAQIKRAAVSIPSNIAEGKMRGSRKDYRHFLLTAFGSGAELETQIEIVKRLQFIDLNGFQTIDKLLDEVMRMLNSLIQKLDE